MSEAEIKPTALITRLIVEFCVPSVRGQVRGQDPVKPLELSEQERTASGLTKPGLTFAYPAKDATVFLDLDDERAQAWFIHPEAQKAREPVERALLTAFPSLKKVDDIEGSDAKRRERIFVGDLGDNKAAQVEINYPLPERGSTNVFAVRVKGLQILDRNKFQQGLTQGATRVEAPKKKGWF